MMDIIKYTLKNGDTVIREYGLTPNGNPIGGHWVRRDAHGKWLDYNQYRHDLMSSYEIFDVYKE